MPWAPNYCEAEDLAAYQQVDGEVDIVQLELAVSASSRAIDGYCGRQFGRVDQAEQRVYPTRYSAGRWQARIDDLADTTDLMVTVDGVEVPAVVLEPRNAPQTGRVWTRLVLPAPPGNLLVSVTAWWGWPAVPDPVTQATLLQANRLMSRRNSPFGVAGSPQQGSELRLLARLDPDVVVMLAGYSRTGLVVG